MTKNQKIAIGCGSAGCLGLIFIVIVVAGVYIWNMGRLKTNPTNRNSDFDFNVNSNSNSDSNSNSQADNENSNSSEPTSPSTNSSRSSSSSSSKMSDDARHKLFHAASLTGDPDLAQRVSVKIGLLKEGGTPGDDYSNFVRDHVFWAANNVDFIRSINTPEKAKAYVDAHIND